MLPGLLNGLSSVTGENLVDNCSFFLLVGTYNPYGARLAFKSGVTSPSSARVHRDSGAASVTRAGLEL